MNSDVNELAERIRVCVGKVGNGADFCRLTGINRRTLDYYLSATSEPKASTLAQIATAANVSLDWLILGTESKKEMSVSAEATPALDAELLEEIIELVDSHFKFEKARIKSSLITKIYAYILKKRAEREASKEKDTAEIIDLIEVLKAAV